MKIVHSGRLIAWFSKLGATLCLLAAASFAGTTQANAGEFESKIKASGVLKVGVDQGRPLVFLDASTGKWNGFYMDAIQDYAAGLGVTVEPVPTTWGNMVAGLQAEQFDIAVALNPTPERAKSVDFSIDLIKDIGGFAVMKDSGISSWQDLNQKGRIICVPLGSAPDATLTKAAPLAKIDRLKGESECQLAVTSKRADGFYWAAANLIGFASSNTEVGLIFPQQPFEAQGTAFAFTKGIDAESLANFNTQLEKYVSSGAMRKSQDKWGFEGAGKYAIGVVPDYVTAAGY